MQVCLLHPLLATEAKENERLPNVWHQLCLKQLQKKSTFAGKTAPSRKRQPASKSLLGAFKDPDFTTSIAPLLQSMIAPTIESAIEKAVDSVIEMLCSTVLQDIVGVMSA